MYFAIPYYLDQGPTHARSYLCLWGTQHQRDRIPVPSPAPRSGDWALPMAELREYWSKAQPITAARLHSWRPGHVCTTGEMDLKMSKIEFLHCAAAGKEARQSHREGKSPAGCSCPPQPLHIPPATEPLALSRLELFPLLPAARDRPDASLRSGMGL